MDHPCTSYSRSSSGKDKLWGAVIGLITDGHDRSGIPLPEKPSQAMSSDTEQIPQDMFCLSETEENNWLQRSKECF